MTGANILEAAGSNVSLPDSPSPLKHGPDVAQGPRVRHVTGSLALVADMNDGLRVIDVSDPEKPKEIGHYEAPGMTYGVTAAKSGSKHYATVVLR